MVVDQARQHAPPVEVDDLGLRAGQRHHLAVGADGQEAAVRDRDGGGGRLRAVERREEAVMEDQVGGMLIGHVRSPVRSRCVVHRRRDGRAAAEHVRRASATGATRRRDASQPACAGHRHDLLADEDAEQPQQRHHGRRRRSDVEQAVDDADQETRAEREKVGALIGHPVSSCHAGTGASVSWTFELRCGALCTIV